MCGLCGIYNFGNQRPVMENMIRDMCNQMTHRGPDDEGLYLDNALGLGHRRLSILDLEGGGQPMCNEDQTVWIVFNGEIYNFRNLRERLKKEGHRFKTNCDTEVIIHAYESYGTDCVSYFDGMFAFAIWDKKIKRLFLARDRIGIKPLYYYLDSKKIVFASEIKSIIAEKTIERTIDADSMDHFLTFGFTSNRHTLFKNIYKLPPGHVMSCEKGSVAVASYWDLSFSETRFNNREHMRKIQSLLENSVRKRLQSDVPLGAFLSGGLDSSSIVAEMSLMGVEPLKTFSVGFDRKGYSELNYARMVADHFKTDHHEITITSKDYLSFFPKFVWHQDEPVADPATIPLYYLSKMARESVTVVLTGEGSDEIFAGYDRYIAEKIVSLLANIPGTIRKKLIAPLGNQCIRYPGLWKLYYLSRAIQNDTFHERYLFFRTRFTSEMKQQIYSDNMKESIRFEKYIEPLISYLERSKEFRKLNRMLYTDTKFWLPEDMLMKKDKMGMAASIEARVPFLDHHLVEYAATIPTHLKSRGLTSKYILKQIMKGILPKPILQRPKKGFPVPLNDWFREDFRDFIQDMLLDGRLKNRGIFNSNYIKQILKRHFDRTAANGEVIFQLLCFEMWCRTFLD